MPNDSKNFIKALQFVLSEEGGYSNNKNDLGGETNKGITRSAYDAYRKSMGLPVQSVKNIADNEVSDIYYKKYWLAAGCDKLSAELALAVFDTAVNMGVGRAKEFLAESRGNVNRYLALRKDKYEEFVKAKPSQSVFLQGWLNRINRLQNVISTLSS